MCKQMTDVNLWLLYSKTWNCKVKEKNYPPPKKKKPSDWFKNIINKMCEQIYLMFKEVLALNNLQ